MGTGSQHLRTRYMVSYFLALGAAFLSYRSFYAFKAGAVFGPQISFLNLGLLLFLWILAFSHNSYVQENFFLLIVIPHLGLMSTNISLLFTYLGTSFLGYLAFLICSSMLIYFSYLARTYEKRLYRSG